MKSYLIRRQQQQSTLMQMNIHYHIFLTMETRTAKKLKCCTAEINDVRDDECEMSATIHRYGFSN